VALTDPELDLLRELLEDDPTADIYQQVGEELVRRGDWAEAREVLVGGLAGGPHEPSSLRLARAALELGDFELALGALDAVEVEPGTEAGRLEVLALERSGRVDDARDRAKAFLEVDPDDVVVTSALERLDSPPPELDQRADDPFYTVERAERYVALGRIDRAIRTYRRILHHHPGHHGVGQRLRQLASEGAIGAADDLSEELTDPGLAPPEFTMPSPDLGARAEDDDTSEVEELAPHVVEASESAATSEEPPTPAAPPTSGAPRKKGRRRRRRSLIRR